MVPFDMLGMAAKVLQNLLNCNAMRFLFVIQQYRSRITLWEKVF